MDIPSLFTSYLLLPVTAAIGMIVMGFMNKRNRLLNNRKMILFVLLTALLLGAPGFLGGLGFYYLPWGFITCEIIYLGLGILAVHQLSLRYNEVLLNRKPLIFFMGLIAGLLGAYLFRLAFNWLSPLGYGWLAATSVVAFLVPPVFWWTYVALASIPSEIYDVWYYPEGESRIELEHLDFDRMKVLDVELYKYPENPSPLKVKVKAPPNMEFGLWFKKFIDDYNQKFPSGGIHFKSDNGETYGWIFYVKRSFFTRRLFVDPALSIEDNRITDRHPIFARRVVLQTAEAGGENRMVIL